MKTTLNIPVMTLAVVCIIYLGGYFFTVQPRLRNPFLSWKGRPLPMEAHYRVSSPVVKSLYEPLARLDQRVFPNRWQWQPSLAFQQSLTNIDLDWIHNEALKRQVNVESDK